MKALIPKGYRLVAVSALPGTGGTEAKAYFSPDTKKVFFVLIDPPTESEIPFGPMETRTLDTLVNVFKDILEMKGKPLTYLEE
jgi:hypothetical protein